MKELLRGTFGSRDLFDRKVGYSELAEAHTCIIGGPPAESVRLRWQITSIS